MEPTTCRTTNARRARAGANPPTAPVLPALSHRMGSTRTMRQRGVSVGTIAAIMTSTSVKATMRQSVVKCRRCGMGAGRLNPPSNASLQPASNNAAAPARVATIRPSAKSRRVRRPRPAPSAARSPSSCCRSTDRARIRPATLKHAISNTRPTTAIATAAAAPSWRASGCPSATATYCARTRSRAASGAIARASVLTSAVTCAALTPGFGRAIIVSHVGSAPASGVSCSAGNASNANQTCGS